MPSLISKTNCPQLWSGYNPDLDGGIDYDQQPIWSRLYDEQLAAIYGPPPFDFLRRHAGVEERNRLSSLFKAFTACASLPDRTAEEEVFLFLFLF